MRIIIVRHGEPDYAIDSLTENGWKEAYALAERTAKWQVDRFYVSPLGRARDTAKPTLEKMHRQAICLDWLREFGPGIVDPSTGMEHCTWDLQPQDYTADPVMMDPDRWFDAPVYAANPQIKVNCLQVWQELDGILAEYGYSRHDGYYDFCDPTGHVNPAEAEDIMLSGTANYELRDTDDEKTIVFFCHFGVTCVMLAHLLGVSPVVLWHGLCIPPTGVTVINAEKRLHNAAHFRIQSLGDTAHLHDAGLPVSGYAAFSPVFQD